MKGFGGCVESFSIKNTGDFILGIVKYGDLINNKGVITTLDGNGDDAIVAGPCKQLCLLEDADFDICKRCTLNPYCMYI